MIDYKCLQNGSDIRGIAMTGVEGEIPNLGNEKAFRLTRGFLLWLSAKCHKDICELVVSVGNDSRLTGDELRETLISTMVSLGVKVFDCGMASTPAMFMTTIYPDYNCDGAIMITASHLPFNRNGFKYFDKIGGLNKEDISLILSYAMSDNIIETMFSPVTKVPNQAIKTDLIAAYSANLRKMIIKQVNSPQDREHPLKGLKIMVDAGNGAGGFYAKSILEPLGANISSSQFLEPDGYFPNHIPNPENKAAMASASQRVLLTKSDFGLIFDTDVDRAAAIDNTGKEISRNAIVAMAAALIAREHPGTTIVTDSITSDQLTVYLEDCLGLTHLRYMRGYKNVINKALELNSSGIDTQLAIETSGHAAYKENYFLDDGAYLATKIVIKAAQLKIVGENISCLIKSLGQPQEAVEFRFSITCPDFSLYGDRVLKELKKWATCNNSLNGCTITVVTPNYEGVRLNFDGPGLKGWCLLRKSLHDPLMPLNIETSVGQCQNILELLFDFIKTCDGLDISCAYN